jgi:hypothetical protein
MNPEIQHLSGGIAMLRFRHLPISVLLTLVLIPAATLLSSCGGGDDNPTSPPPAEFEPVLLSEATIGAEGGELTHEDVVITVPPGSLDSDEDLALYALEDVAEDEVVTGQYRLVGLPAGAVAQLTVPFTGTLAGETYLMVRDGRATEEDDDGGAVLVEATVGDGVLTGTLILAGEDKSDEDVLADFLGVSNFETFHLPSEDQRYFRCRVPANRRAAFESAMAPSVALWSDLRSWGWPTQGTQYLFDDHIDFEPIAALVLPRVTNSALGYVDIEGDPQLLVPHHLDCTFKIPNAVLDPASLTGTRSHFLGSFCLQYLTTVITLEQEDSRQILWYLGAFREWALRTYLEEDQQPTAYSPESALQTLEGLYQGAHQNHGPDLVTFGPGMGTFLRWITEHSSWGTDWLLSLRNNIQNELMPTPENIIATCTGQTSDQWWHNYVRDLLEGDIAEIGDVPVVNAASGVWSINDDQDVQQVFHADYPDLSARIYSVRLDHNGIDESAEARFSLESAELDLLDMELMVFKRQGGELTHLASGQEVWIGGLREMRMSGAHLLAVVSNAYYESPFDIERGASLTVEIEEAPEGGVFEKPRVDFRIGLILENLVYTGDECLNPYPSDSNNYTFNLDDGTWTGTTFHISYDETFTEPVDYRNQIELSITLNNDGTVVESFHLDFTQTQYGSESQKVEHLVVNWSGGGVPYTGGAPGYYTYQIIGTTIGDHINTWNHTTEWSDRDCVRSTQSIEPTNYSIVRVEFQN